jgi:uncharacterized damage-inducible protein DinB
MSIAQSLLPELDQENATTRKYLERVPEDQLGFQPHPKSMTMAHLASHVASIQQWGATTLTTDSFDISPPGGEPYRPHIAASRAELLEIFDKAAAQFREALAAATDEQFLASWSLLAGGNTLFTLPRVAVLRGMILNHLVHHRGQLSVYFRLTGVPVPSTYGPSADEGQS